MGSLGVNFKMQKEMRVESENWTTCDFQQDNRVWMQDIQNISLIMVFLYLNQALLLNFEPFYVGLNGKLVACELRWVGVS